MIAQGLDPALVASQVLAPAWLRMASEASLSAWRFSSAGTLDLMLDEDLLATVRLHPDGTSVAVDLWCGDAGELEDADRRLLVEMLLRLNARYPDKPWCWIGLDSRSLVLMHGRAEIEALSPQGFLPWLEAMVDEARELRSLVAAITP